MKHYVTTIYFNCADDTDAAQASVIAAERVEQFSPDVQIEDVHTEEYDSTDHQEASPNTEKV